MDVFVGVSDLMAIGAMGALMELDVFHPVCGFDEMCIRDRDFAEPGAVKFDRNAK